jgi:hypothetical protein
MAGGSGYEPSSWEELSGEQQDEIFTKWRDATYDEFYDSEVENWRDSGQALEDAKQALADEFEQSHLQWTFDALEKVSNETGVALSHSESFDILSATTLAYKSRYGDGKADPDVTIDADKLSEPLRAKVTDDMRDKIEAALVDMFNKLAEQNAGNAEPPEHLGEGISDYQGEVWDSMRDRDKFAWARDHGELPEGEAGTGEIDEDEASALRDLADSNDPKAIWSIADSDHGKELLLNTDWQGSLDLHDKETMDRFNAYVGKKASA